MVYTKPITGSWFEFLHHNTAEGKYWNETITACLLYTSPNPRDHG